MQGTFCAMLSKFGSGRIGNRVSSPKLDSIAKSAKTNMKKTIDALRISESYFGPLSRIKKS
jgi:hypothetical protein